jgi:hypothetical protein
LAAFVVALAGCRSLDRAGWAAGRIASAAPGSALAGLRRLPVAPRAPDAGYQREAFGAAWADVDGNGCDTRDDVLRRDLDDVVLKPDGCEVSSGTLRDPYTGHVIHFVRGPQSSLAVQIDHVVALSDAWQTGAQTLSPAQRQALANDPMELLAVDGPANEDKSDGDAASWLPPNRAFRCAYVARQIAVKAKYGLWVTSAEWTAMARVLLACPG